MKTEQTEVQATKQTAFPLDGLVDAKAITAYLAISPAMLSKLRKAGAIKPPVKIGASARWDVAYIRSIAATGITLPKQSTTA